MANYVTSGRPHDWRAGGCGHEFHVIGCLLIPVDIIMFLHILLVDHGGRRISKQFGERSFYNATPLFMPRLGGAYCFRRVRSQRKSVDWGNIGPALGGAYECYAHISSLECLVFALSPIWTLLNEI